METWEDTKNKVNTMIEADTLGSLDDGLRIVCTHLIATGDSKPEMQEQMAKSLREVLRGSHGYPWRRGGGGILSATALSTVDAIVANVEDNFATAFNIGGAGLRALLVPHGKSKKSHFDNGADYASTLTKTIRKNATTLFKAGWDGNLETLDTYSSQEEE